MRKTFSLPVAATAAGGGPTPPPPADTVDNIEHSVRFNSADSAYMSRTPSSAGNRKTWTWSGWVKRSELGSFQDIWGNADTSALNGFLFRFDTADKIDIYDLTTATQWRLVTTQVFRDTSAWYHFVISFDTTNATAGDRVRLYVNGVRIEDFSLGSDPSLNYEGHINNTNQHAIGRTGQYNSFYLSAYLANIQFVDGQALTPSSFGFTDSSGVWQPKAYSGSYGTNGFYLDFADTSSATALGNDVSGNNNDWTPSGLVAGPAYTANSFSTEFDGTGDYLSIPSSTDLQFGTGDWTIEHWVYIPSGTSMLSYWRSSVGVSGDSNTVNAATIYFGSGLVDSSVISEPAFIGPSNAYRLYSGVDIRGKWTHVAVTKASNTVRLFVDGILKASQSDSNNYNATGNTLIGVSNLSQNNYFLGKISNVRVIKGRALYTAAFTPPSTALTATDDTVLLTCQDATVRDNSNIGHDVTAGGDVAVVNEGPFNGYSGNFDGNGDYLNISATADFDLGSAKTYEFWLKLYTVSTNKIFVGSFFNHWFNIGYTGIGGAANKVGFSAWDGSSWNAINSTTSIATGSWYHVAATWDGTYAKLYLNGVLEATSADWSAKTWASNNGNAYNIGAIFNDNASSIAGVISNLRITDSVLYTAAFTPPTADLTTTSQGATASNVKLLTCQNSTFIDNSPSAHTITANGNAKTVSVNPHTDKYSVTFDGTGDYLTVPSSTEFDFGSGDWTLECWIKYTTGNQDYGLINRSNGGASSNSAWILYLTNGAPSLYTTSGTGWTNNITPSSTYNDGKWHHIAATRNGSDMYLYVDGTQVGTTTAPTIPVSTRDVEIGAQAGAYTFDGEISNVRITKGQALYTSNFLPPTEDLTTTSQGATASNVKLLTCQSYKIQDNSPSAHTITVNGDAAPSTDAPFVTSGAGSFDGTGDYLTITNSTDHNPGTGDFTIEGWFKTSATVSYQTIISKYGAPNANYGWYFGLDSAGTGFRAALFDGSSGTPLELTGGTNLNNGAWHHFAVTRSGTSAKLFIDGTSVSSATNSFDVTATSDLRISGYPATSRDWNGQLSNVRISKGLARYTANFTPPTEDFDPTDQDTTFLALQGNNLDDLSGNDHAVTANGDAATSTVSPFEPVDGSDAMLDSPTNYGSGDTVRGNYCTLNPLTGSSAFTLTNGNLDVSDSGASSPVLMGTIGVNSGKWYWEVTLGNVGAYTGAAQVTSTGSVAYLGATSGQFIYNTNAASSSWIDGSGYNYSTASGAAAGDVIGVALNFDSNEITFYKNGVSQGVFGSNVLGTSTWTPAFKSNVSTSATFNFGQQPFKYPLAGYKSLCSTNLPTPAVADGSTAMDVALYTGTSSALAVSTPNMSPDLVWIKRRDFGWSHRLYDSIRGAGTTTALYSDRTDSEGALNAEDLDSFDSAGFTVGPASPLNGINAVGGTFAAWTWDAGSSTVSNTDGTLTSSVRANPTAGVSIVTYNGTSNSTIGHGLQAKPSLIIVKNKDNTSSWQVYSEALGATKYLILNLTNGEGTNIDRWNNTEPTSSVFTIGSNAQVLGNCVAYCFAPVEGFSAFGSFTGSTSNTFVYTGMRPRWLMIKRTDTTGDWQILDTEREGYNVDNDPLWANLTDQEGTTDIADILSNGFKMRDGATGDYIYAAFAEHPFKTSRAR